MSERLDRLSIERGHGGNALWIRGSAALSLFDVCRAI